MSVIATIARQELVVNIRNRWTMIFALVFGILIVGISYFGTMAEGFSGIENFSRTSASILNLILYIVPLAALIMGTLSFAGDKGSMELLYSQPVSRTQIQIGKLAGLFASAALSMLIGFAGAGALIAQASGTDGLIRYSMLVGLTLLLSLVFLVMSMFSATLCRRTSKAFGVSLFLWFFFVILYDLLALGIGLALRGRASTTALFLSLFGNPVDMVRVSGLIILDNVTIFGAAGASLIRFVGGGTAGIVLLLGSLLAWIVVPVAGTHSILRKQDI